VSSVMSVIKDFEFGEWIFFHYIIIKYILLVSIFTVFRCLMTLDTNDTNDTIGQHHSL